MLYFKSECFVEFGFGCSVEPVLLTHVFVFSRLVSSPDQTAAAARKTLLTL